MCRSWNTSRTSPLPLRSPESLRVRHDARGILAAMLQHRQRIVERLVHGLMTDDSDEATHKRATYLVFFDRTRSTWPPTETEATQSSSYRHLTL